MLKELKRILSDLLIFEANCQIAEDRSEIFKITESLQTLLSEIQFIDDNEVLATMMVVGAIEAPSVLRPNLVTPNRNPQAKQIQGTLTLEQIYDIFPKILKDSYLDNKNSTGIIRPQ